MIIPVPGVNSYLPKLLYLLVGAALLIAPSSTLLMNVYGQIFPNAQRPDFTNTSITSHQKGKPNLHLVKIISPTKGPSSDSRRSLW